MEDLCVGDLVIIEPGKTVPADCILIQSADMQANESSLTGETEIVYKQNCNHENYKSNPNPFLLQSTVIENGEGKAIVCAVGEKTQAGKAARTLDIQDDLTPL